MSIFFKGTWERMHSGEQFGISFKGTVKKQFLGIREILKIVLGNTGTQSPLGGLVCIQNSN